MLLIGITVSLVSLRLGHDPKKLAEDEARRFAALLEHVRDESIQTGTVFAVELDADGRGYRFLRPAPKWTPVQRDSLLRPRALAEPLRATLDVPGSPPGAPAWIFLTPAGEISPFRFRLRLPGQATAYLVQLDANQTPRVSADAG